MVSLPAIVDTFHTVDFQSLAFLNRGWQLLMRRVQMINNFFHHLLAVGFGGLWL